MKEAFFSKEAMNYLQTKYPHVSQSMFNGLLNQYGLEREGKEDIYNQHTYVFRSKCVLKLPDVITDHLGVDSKIELPESVTTYCYQPINDIDSIDALMYAYEHMSKQENKPLLTIELQDEEAVPKVVYKGEEIKHKKNIRFDWETDTDQFGGLSYTIEHIETGNEVPTINLIERKVKGHAFD